MVSWNPCTQIECHWALLDLWTTPASLKTRWLSTVDIFGFGVTFPTQMSSTSIPCVSMQKNPNPNMSNASAVGELLLDTCLFVVDKDFDVVRHIDCVAFIPINSHPRQCPQRNPHHWWDYSCLTGFAWVFSFASGTASSTRTTAGGGLYGRLWV